MHHMAFVCFRILIVGEYVTILEQLLGGGFIIYKLFRRLPQSEMFYSNMFSQVTQEKTA